MARLEKEKNRRQILISVGRYGVLGFLAAATGTLLAKRRRLIREGKCVNGWVCSGCGVFEGCGLPQALSAKQFLKRKSNG